MRLFSTALTLAIGGLLLLTSAASAAQEPAKAKSDPLLKPPDPVPPPDLPPPEDGGALQFVYNTDQAIEFFQAKVALNPDDFTSYRHLGEFHLRKAEQGGGLPEFVKAEAALRRSLELFPDAPRARASLAAALSSQHKFAEALAIARELVRQDPRDVDALATMGDALLETGQYPEAEAAFRDLQRLAPIPPVTARLANLAELKGDHSQALELMGRAATEARGQSATPKADAWYVARLGDIALAAGRLDDADRHYAAVPEGVDPYHDATFGLGRVRLAQGQLDEALPLLEKAVGIGPDPHMLALLGDLYVHANQPEKAAPLFAQLERETEGQAAYLRERSYFLADHDRKLPEALELAQLDYQQRKDVFGSDALAWALFKNGRVDEARDAIDAALKLGTQDARLFYHAGLIYDRLGRNDEARSFLNRALSLNPPFPPAQLQRARDALGAPPAAP